MRVERAPVQRRRAACSSPRPGRAGRRACARTRSSIRREAARARCRFRETVGRLVERAVAGEHGDDVEAVVGGRARESGGVTATRRLGDLDFVLVREHLADHDARAGRDRGCRGVDQQEHPHRRSQGTRTIRRCLCPWPPISPRSSPRSRRVPGVPAARRVAGAGRAREARGRSVTRRTGAGRSPASGIRDARVLSSGSRRPRTAGTAPAGSSPAIGPATSCSRRCTAPGSRTSRRRTTRDDGLVLQDMYITAAVRCAPPANKPTPAERDECRPYLVRELELLERIRVVVVARRVRLRGGVGRAPAGGLRAPARAGRGSRTASRCACGRVTIVGAFHPSQQNTFTGRLDPADARRGVRACARARPVISRPAR